MPDICPPKPWAWRRPALALAALVSAGATYYVLWAGRVMAEAHDFEPGSIDGLAVPFVRSELGTRFYVAAFVAVVSAAVAAALGVVWLRRDRKGPLVALSLAPALLAWGALAAFAVAGEWRAP